MLRLLIQLCFFFSLVKTDQCPAFSFLSPDGTTCIGVIDDVSTWQAASSICKYRGGNLLSVNSKVTNDFILQLFNASSNNSVFHYADDYFIGGIYKNGAWAWIDGTPMDYTNFFPKQINLPEEGSLLAVRGLLVNGSGQWDIMRYDDQIGFLCQLPKCSSTNLPMNLDPKDPNTGLYWGQASNRFYAGNLNNHQSPSFNAYACTTMGGFLPSVANAFENAEIQTAAQVLIGKQFDSLDYYLSIGYATTGPQGLNGWNWMDGSNSTFKKWAPGEPQNFGGFLYAAMDVASGRWWSEVDFEPMSYICELQVPRTAC